MRSQNSGKTWNEVVRREKTEGVWGKLVNLLGVNDYQVELPNAVASVRGTSFGIDLTEDRLVVLEGQVNLLYNQLKPEEALIINKDEETGKEAGMKEEGKLIEREQLKVKPLERDGFVEEGFLMREKGLTTVKERIKVKYDRVIKVAKNEYQLTDEDIDQGIDDYLRGNLDLRTLQEMDTKGVLGETGVTQTRERTIKTKEEISQIEGEERTIEGVVIQEEGEEADSSGTIKTNMTITTVDEGAEVVIIS